jgi:shikimate dehydrogenase
VTELPTGSARVAGVTGWPVKHSLSPRLHGYWLKKHGVDGIYAPFPIAPEGFETAVRGLQAAGVKGVNVTVPHKLAAHRIADRLDPAAQLVGAVNTLVFHDDGTIEGRNTDAPGFLANLQHYHVDVTAGPALLFGAGGAARAAVQALLEAGTPEIRILNRNADRAEALIADTKDARVKYCGMTSKMAEIRDIHLVVNTTSVGMSGQGELDLDVDALPNRAVVHDIVYTPLKTSLLSRAEAADLKTVDGLGMLLHQAVPAFEVFFGVCPEVNDGLRSYLLEVL